MALLLRSCEVMHACRCIRGNHALLPTHDNEIIASQCMQSTNHMARFAAILWKNRPTGDVNAWCVDQWIDRADRLAEAIACCVSLYIICDSSKFLLAQGLVIVMDRFHAMWSTTTVLVTSWYFVVSRGSRYLFRYFYVYTYVYYYVYYDVFTYI